ncbi:hypothetical protein XENOCAPTIV_023738 [Xenoophorus captivus]|uniref:Uncharacterized protein n=1 Tax=Xenoophorus captivus TaxID=1517983 RepID=A0ABV0Q5Y7_9TELE
MESSENLNLSSFLVPFFPRFPHMVVKVSRVLTGETFGADVEIMEKVKNNKRPRLHVVEAPPEGSNFMIVFCPISFCVGSDVESALKDDRVLSSDTPVILVLMHHTRDVDYSAEGTKWSEVYKNVALDVRVLFHETKPGLLKCKQNDEAIKAIQQVLRSYKE